MQSNNLPRRACRDDRRQRRQGQSHGPVQRLRVRARRSDPQEPALGVGRLSARRTSTSSPSAATHDRTELKDSSFKAHRPGHDRHPRQLHVLPRRQAEVRPRRRPDPRRRSHLRPERPDDLAEGRRQLRRRQQPVPGGARVARRRRLPARGPRRADDADVLDDGGVMRGSTDTYTTDRPQNNVSFDGNSFKGKHELKFGFGWRKATVDSSDVYPGNGVVTYHIGYPGHARQDHPAESHPDRHGLHERLRRRHLVDGSPDAESRPALGSPGGLARRRDRSRAARCCRRCCRR